MANGTWKRSTTKNGRAERKIRYAHVSVKVGVTVSESTGMLIPSRTPKGAGSTATRKEPKSKARAQKGHDWSGIYFGKPASLEALRRTRRNARKHARRFAGSPRAVQFANLGMRVKEIETTGAF